jgi:hypothetical protein
VRKLLTALACGTLLFADMTIILTPADARGLSRERMRRNARVTTHARVDGQYVYRNGHWGYWHNGVWVAAPAFGYGAVCAYEYRRWRSTGSSYWRNRYRRCVS